jgi:hypothetical protein
MISAAAAALGLPLPKREEQGAGGDGTVRVVTPVTSGRSAPASRAVNRLELWGSAHPRALGGRCGGLGDLAPLDVGKCSGSSVPGDRPPGAAPEQRHCSLDGRSAPAGSPRRPVLKFNTVPRGGPQIQVEARAERCHVLRWSTARPAQDV